MRADLPIPIYVDKTTSTNSFLRGLLVEHPETECWQAVYTNDQTEGRGQRGNTWNSESGKNLTMSFLFRSNRLHHRFEPFDICVFVSLALREVIKEYLPEADVSIKWPNDIYVGDKKVAGILIENDWEGAELRQAIVGIGVNLNQVHFPEDIPNPTSIILERGDQTPIDKEKFMKRYLHEVVKIWRQMKSDVVSPRDEYNMHLYRKDGKIHEFESIDGHINGYVLGVDPQGFLLIDEAEKGIKRRYAFKEVSYII